MALGKKKKQDDPAPAGAEVSEAPEDDDNQLVAGVVLDEQCEVAKPADPLAGGTDALLSMFQSTEARGEDRSVPLDLAGEVDLADLLEDLHTMAAALGIDLSIAA